MTAVLRRFRAKVRLYWPLTKSLQTGLLLSTGLAGFMSARCPVLHGYDFLGLGLSLFLAIAGSTILNMWYDRDLDAVMNRTHHRPLADGRVSPAEAVRLGLVLSALGVGLAMAMDLLYGLIVLAGLFFDVIVYTAWLKRRTGWSIVWGGIAGGMPILAGRSYGIGGVRRRVVANVYGPFCLATKQYAGFSRSMPSTRVFIASSPPHPTAATDACAL